MATIITVDDLPSALRTAEMAEAMVAGANARASRVAPCLADLTNPPTDDQMAEARLVLIGAVRRWLEAGAGSLQSQAAGPFNMTVDTRQRTGYALWPSEIEALQAICASGTDTSSKAFSISPHAATSEHLDWCSVNFGAAFCSCGADIAGHPIYELGGDGY